MAFMKVFRGVIFEEITSAKISLLIFMMYQGKQNVREYIMGISNIA